MNCESLRNIAKLFETIFARMLAKAAAESLRNPSHICESVRNLSISANAYLPKLAKTYAFRTYKFFVKTRFAASAKPWKGTVYR